MFLVEDRGLDGKVVYIISESTSISAFCRYKCGSGWRIVAPSGELVNETAGPIDCARAEVTHGISRRRSWQLLLH